MTDDFAILNIKSDLSRQIHVFSKYLVVLLVIYNKLLNIFFKTETFYLTHIGNLVRMDNETLVNNTCNPKLVS